MHPGLRVRLFVWIGGAPLSEFGLVTVGVALGITAVLLMALLIHWLEESRERSRLRLPQQDAKPATSPPAQPKQPAAPQNVARMVAVYLDADNALCFAARGQAIHYAILDDVEEAVSLLAFGNVVLIPDDDEFQQQLWLRLSLRDIST